MSSDLIICILNYLQIRASPQARAFFAKSCQQVEVPILQLLLWIRTCRASLFAFLDRLLILKKVCFYVAYSDPPGANLLRSYPSVKI